MLLFFGSILEIINMKIICRLQSLMKQLLLKQHIVIVKSMLMISKYLNLKYQIHIVMKMNFICIFK